GTMGDNPLALGARSTAPATRILGSVGTSPAGPGGDAETHQWPDPLALPTTSSGAIVRSLTQVSRSGGCGRCPAWGELAGHSGQVAGPPAGVGSVRKAGLLPP